MELSPTQAPSIVFSSTSHLSRSSYFFSLLCTGNKNEAISGERQRCVAVDVSFPLERDSRFQNFFPPEHTAPKFLRDPKW